MSTKPSSRYVSLHTHTEYSLLDGHATIADLATKAAEDGQPGLAITDHGNLSGMIEQYRECEKHGLAYIPGIEAYQARESVEDRPKVRKTDDSENENVREKAYYHLILLARNNAGVRNLMHLTAESFSRGFYHKNRVDWEMLDRYSEGLNCSTACLGGLVAQSLMAEDYNQAVEYADRLKQIFGKDHTFIELADHGIPEQRQIWPQLLRVAKDLDLKAYVAQDSHYCDHDHQEIHDVMITIQTRDVLSNPDKFSFHGDLGHHFKTYEEMRHLVGEDELFLLHNTLEIIEQTEIKLDYTSYDVKMPKYPVPAGETTDSYFQNLCVEGLRKKYGDHPGEDILAQLDLEIGVMQNLGFCDYFLVTQDAVNYAKDNGGIVGPGRGSAAGSLVAYTLGITDVEPTSQGLSFERFLSYDRIHKNEEGKISAFDVPDIDIDIASSFRGQLISYLQERYGEYAVAQVGTQGRIQARMAVKDVARVMGLPQVVAAEINDCMPSLKHGKPTPLAACMEEDEEWAEQFEEAKPLRDKCKTSPDAREIVRIATALEGRMRQLGKHAGAVIIADRDLRDVVPQQIRTADDLFVTQVDMDDCAAAGLIKWDFLGLGTLDVIGDTVRSIEETSGVQIDPWNISDGDEKTYAMLGRGHSVGVFQLSKPVAKRLLAAIKPTSIRELADISSLNRPGPLDAGMDKDYTERAQDPSLIHPFHPDADEILAPSLGLMVYQEQLMKVAQIFAGYTGAEANDLRAAVGKKKAEKIAAHKDMFINGAIENGYDPSMIHQVWSDMEGFGAYAFNLSHAYAYSMISYACAYLKAHYPHQFMAALLTNEADDPDKATVNMAEVRRMEINLLPPNINKSGMGYEADVEDNSILFGFQGIKGIGEKPALEIMRARGEKPFTSFQDFVDRVNRKIINKARILSLVAAGAFDLFEESRKGMMQELDRILKETKSRTQKTGRGMNSFLDPSEDMAIEVPNIPITHRELMSLEMEYLGAYVSADPLQGKGEELSKVAKHFVSDLIDDHGSILPTIIKKDRFEMAGVFVGVEERITKKGEPMANAIFHDQTGQRDVLIFPRTWREQRVYEGQLCIAKVSVADDGKFILQSIRDVNSDRPKPSKSNKGFKIYLPWSLADETAISRVRRILEKHRGFDEVEIYIAKGLGIQLPKQWRCNAKKPALREELKMTFGPDVID